MKLLCWQSFGSRLVYRKIQLPTAQKAGLYAVFSAGLFVVAAGSVRTYYLYSGAAHIKRIYQALGPLTPSQKSVTPPTLAPSSSTSSSGPSSNSASASCAPPHPVSASFSAHTYNRHSAGSSRPGHGILSVETRHTGEAQTHPLSSHLGFARSIVHTSKFGTSSVTLRRGKLWSPQ